MQKKLSQFVRLLFALVVAFGVLVPIGANAQPPIDVPGIGPAITVSGQTLTRAWGGGSDVPVPADYDGDGYANIAVWRPSNGVWYVIKRDGSSTGVTMGVSGDIPLSHKPW